MNTQVIRLYGDPNKKREPDETRIEFPGGYIYVSRTGCGYWAHVGVHRRYQDVLDAEGDADPSNPETARITDARLDCYDKHASDTRHIGEAIAAEGATANHLAVRIELDRPRCTHKGCHVPATFRCIMGNNREGYTCGNHAGDKDKSPIHAV